MVVFDCVIKNCYFYIVYFMALLLRGEFRLLFLKFSGEFLTPNVTASSSCRLVAAQSEDTCFMREQVVPEGAQDGFG